MDFALNQLNNGVLMDFLALSVSLVLIAILVVNRRRYGRMVAGPDTESAFHAQIKLQMLNQQSQRSYTIIQQALRDEFAALQRMTGGDPMAVEVCPSADQTPMAVVNPVREGHYDEAFRLIRNGADPQNVAERCGVARSAIDLMIYMQHKRA